MRQPELTDEDIELINKWYWSFIAHTGTKKQCEESDKLLYKIKGRL